MRPLPVLLALGLGATPLAAQGNAEAARLQWMAGCWRAESPRRTVEEQWMKPAGGLLLGMSRASRADSVLSWELARIETEGGRLQFVAWPSGQRQAAFAATIVNDSMVVFTNPQHDFPQRIMYLRRGTDSLLARVEGPVQGETRGLDFLYARVACEGSGRR